MIPTPAEGHLLQPHSIRMRKKLALSLFHKPGPESCDHLPKTSPNKNRDFRDSYPNSHSDMEVFLPVVVGGREGRTKVPSNPKPIILWFFDRDLIQWALLYNIHIHITTINTAWLCGSLGFKNKVNPMWFQTDIIFYVYAPYLKISRSIRSLQSN